MSFSPFPPRGVDSRPPVPPKTSALPHISHCFASANIPHQSKHKKSMPSMSKTVTFDITSPIRNVSPTKYPYDPSPVQEEHPNIPVKTESSGGNSPISCFSASPPQAKLSGLASAKQKAKEAWTRRRMNPTESETVPEYCMDSPTIPGRPALVPECSASAMGWRQCMYSDALVSRIISPTVVEQPNQRGVGSPELERPISPLALPPSPHTPWPGAKKIPPQVPPKTIPALQKAPTFLEKTPPVVTSPPLGKPGVFRPRADSEPVANGTPCSCKPSLGVETTRPGSADSMVPPLMNSQEKKRHCHKRNNSSISTTTLPQGLRPSQAVTQYPQADIETVKKAAKQQSAKFDVLKPRDVDCLSRELSQLGSRCQYLRETHKSLRAGRKTLHTRMIMYLRSPRSGVFSRESLLKQEEALAELDAAIDDWQNKLEKAEDRRNQVHQKLLEHVAAALVVPNEIVLPKSELATPPATPEKQKRHRTERESITVYALLADVEQEINHSVPVTAHN